MSLNVHVSKMQIEAVLMKKSKDIRLEAGANKTNKENLVLVFFPVKNKSW